MEDEIYYAVAAAALIGITLVVYDIATTEKPHEQFTELYFQYERKTLDKETEFLKTNFSGINVYVNGNEVWMDFNDNTMKDTDELLFKGDSFTIADRDWNITDLTDKEILFGAYPTEKKAGEFTFSFYIVNHLGKNHVYDCTMFVDGVSLQNEKTEIATEEKKLLTLKGEIKDKISHRISVKLDTGEEIYFWVNMVQTFDRNLYKGGRWLTCMKLWGDSFIGP